MSWGLAKVAQTHAEQPTTFRNGRADEVSHRGSSSHIDLVMAAAPDSVIFHHLWLLWLAAGVAVCLPPVFESPFLGFLLSVLIILLWICTNVSPKRILGWFFMSVIEIFFREIGVRNQFKVPPQNVPCLFVCAPHSNLFLDALVVMHAVGRLDLCFLTAAKSMRKRILGTLMRINEAIPVERSADLAFSGMGRIWLSPEDCVTVLGSGPRFAEQVRPGDSLAVDGREPAVVQSVQSDESLTLKRPWRAPENVASEGGHDASGGAESSGDAAGGEGLVAEDVLASGEWCEFKVHPHVDQTGMFDAVIEALRQGRAVGIFPEGGSHDRPSLLPFRAGVAIMALSSLAKHPNLPIRLVPVGLNYFSGHRFRSRVVRHSPRVSIPLASASARHAANTVRPGRARLACEADSEPRFRVPPWTVRGHR